MTKLEILLSIIFITHTVVTMILSDSDIKICKELNRLADENKCMKDKAFMDKCENFKF